MITDASGVEIAKDSRLVVQKCEVLAPIVIASGEEIPAGTVINLPYREVIQYADKVIRTNKKLTPKYA